MSASHVQRGRHPHPSRASGNMAPRAPRPRVRPPRARRPSSRPASWTVHREPRPSVLRGLATNRTTASDKVRHGFGGGRGGRIMTSKDNFEFAHEHRRDVAWMSQNTNTLPVHPSILEAIRQSVEEREFNLYPRKAGIFGLPEAIREDLGLEDVDMILTNGGIEGEYIATRALLKAGDEALSTDPSFLPIHDQVAMTGAKAVEVDIYRKPYVLTPEAAEPALTPATKMLLVIDPNNPLGSGYTRSQIKGLAEIARDHDLWFIDDITYRDFSPDHVRSEEHTSELQSQSNL